MAIAIERADFEKDILELVDKDIDQFKDYAVAELRENTPIDTGRARRGWRKGFDDTIAYNDVEYIEYLEAGHSRQAPNGFIEESILDAVRRIEN